MARHRPGGAGRPGGSVRGPRHVVTCGETPVLDPPKHGALLDSIDTGKVVGLRDRALIGLMVYSFARIGAALGMVVEDVYTQNRPGCRSACAKKGGKRDAMPSRPTTSMKTRCVLDGARLRDDPS